MEPFLSKDGKTFVTHEEVQVTRYGLRVIDADDKMKIIGSDNVYQISLDGYAVLLNKYEVKWIVDLKAIGKVPALYVVRTPAPTYRFVCGFDLLSNGRVWVGIGDSRFDTMVEALAFLDEQLKEPYYISLEEAFPI